MQNAQAASLDSERKSSAKPGKFPVINLFAYL